MNYKSKIANKFNLHTKQVIFKGLPSFFNSVSNVASEFLCSSYLMRQLDSQTVLVIIKPAFLTAGQRGATTGKILVRICSYKAYKNHLYFTQIRLNICFMFIVGLIDILVIVLVLYNLCQGYFFLQKLYKKIILISFKNV